MKIISIGSDRKLFETGSRVAGRIIEYGKEVEEMHIIVFSLASLGLRPLKLSSNVWLYPTASLNRLWYIADALRIGRELIKNRPLVRGNALITTQDPFEAGLVGVLLKRIFKLPLQVQLHTDIGSSHFGRGFNRMRLMISGFVFKRADTVRTVHTTIAGYVTKEFSVPMSRISILPVFLDKEEIRKALGTPDLHLLFPQFDTIVLMVGRLEEEKNYPFALTLFSEIVKAHPRAGLIIVGQGREEEYLKQLASELHIKESVVFESSPPNLISFYKSADIFLHTSVFEGYGLVFAEAALSECPIVSSKVGIVRNLRNGEEALLCEVDDSDCFLSSLKHLIAQKEMRIHLARSGREAVDRMMPSREEFFSRLKAGWEQTLSFS